MKITYDGTYNEPKPKEYHAIKCLTCKTFVTSKAEAKKSHSGHEVHYVNDQGQIDD